MNVNNEKNCSHCGIYFRWKAITTSGEDGVQNIFCCGERQKALRRSEAEAACRRVGLITLPVAVPANITSVLYVQIRMIAAIATLGGHDIRSDQVRTLVYMCLCGSAITDLLKDVGIQVGAKLTKAAINKISGATITKINQTVGVRLVTKFGQTGAINLGKAVPFIGGVIGGTVDALATKTIGTVAINTFIEKPVQCPLN